MAAIATVAQVITPVQSAGKSWALPAVPGRTSGSEGTLNPDYRLVDRCLGGEEAAWEDLVRTHTRRVYSICFRFTSSQTDAQDITQEVFLRVFRTLKSFRAGEGSFVVWLSRLTRNLLIDHYRRTRMDRATDSIEDRLPVLEGWWPAGRRARSCKRRCGNCRRISGKR
jgi:RNA polymerase sigma-70 factor (ECF subfamily)